MAILDEQLIIQSKAGDRNAFTNLILSINDDLYKIAKTKISNEDDIEDAVQETMIEAFKPLKKLKDNDKFKGWIFTILINKCNRIYRRKFKKDMSYDNEFEFISGENSFKKIEDDLNFYDIIKCLDDDERLIITLYYMENLKIKEISKIMKKNENTINTKLYRARKK